MPVVLRYDAVQQLGSLAFQAGYQPGYATGRFQGRQLAEREAGRLDARDAEIRRLQENARQFNETTRLRRDLATQQLQTQQAVAQQRTESTERIAGARGEAELAAAERERVVQSQRDRMLQQQQLERIEHEARLGKYARRTTGKAPPAPPGQGLPTSDYIDQELQQYAHLLPYRAGGAPTAGAAARDAEKQHATGKSLLNMPNAQIADYVEKRPDDPYTPILRAALEGRRAAAGQVQGAVQPQVPGAPTPTGNQGPLGTGPGLGQSDAQLGQLNISDLDAFAGSMDAAMRRQLEVLQRQRRR